MCGVVGIFGNNYVSQDLYDALMTIQHRGQDACGMITFDGKFHVRKNLGLVKEVFHTRHMKKLTGYVGIGHTRYSTVGNGDAGDAQPFLGPAPFGVVLGHNGNLFNSYDLKKELFEKDHRLVNSDCDAEVLLNLFTKALTKQNLDVLEPENVWKAVESVYSRAKGSYSAVAYIARQGMVAFRDPFGIRPLVFGKRDNGVSVDYMFASESVTLDITGFTYVRDVMPGEAIFIDEKTREVHSKVLGKKGYTPCIFEYIYFARPDSILNGISVYKARWKMGSALAKKIKKAKWFKDIDVVMPVPDSSVASALALAEELGIKYQEGLVKNRYIGRTFIMPGQEIRKKSIKYKLNPMRSQIEGKKILLIDDSIVRGNTSGEIIQMVRDAGAAKVFFASYSPPVISPCLYGIDIPTREELIGSVISIDQIRKFIGADELVYQEIDDVFKACTSENPALKDLCMSCFDGKYKTGDITEAVIKKNAESRLIDKGQECDVIERDVGGRVDLDKQLNLI